MPVIPNMRSSSPNGLQGQAPPTPLSYVDTPAMDYTAWLSGVGASIADIPNASGFGVAVIGSGAAGLAAAYELLRCGVNVALFEATGRIGGRLFSSPSSTNDGNIFEMGAMRFTPSEWVLHHYANVFTASGASNVEFATGLFPDPGDGDLTYVAFQGQTYVHVPGSPDSGFPRSAAIVSAGWNALIESGFQSADGTIDLTAPVQITTLLATPGNVTAVQVAWQPYLNHFANSSLYEAMVRIFTDANAPGGTVWTPTEFEFFGALGTGFGGMGPLYSIEFLDIIRFNINAVDSDQHELVTGVQSIVNGFLDQPIALPGGTVTLRPNLFANKPVKGMAKSANGSQVVLTFGDGTTGTFDRVVVATSHRSMELTMNLGSSVNGFPLAEPVADAVRRLHLSNSSKVFVEANNPFWTQAAPGGLNWPRNVVGDTILRNFYVLTYPNAPASTGAVLFSYTWEDDSVKQQTITNTTDRLNLLLTDLNTISPDFTRIVVDSINFETAQLVDWQNESYYYGAFKLNLPGQDPYVESLFYDFQKAGTGKDTYIYLAGDSIGFLGGWSENALETGVNAAAGVAVSLGGTLNNAAQGPIACLPALYDYGAARQAGGPEGAGAPPHPGRC